MKKILLTCFLDPIAIGTCLFQKARIKLKAKKEHLGFPSPSTAPRCDVLIKYLAVGVSHVAKRSVFRAAYLQNKLVLTSPLCLTLTLLCCTSPTLSKSAQSPPEPSIHRSAVHVSPHSGDTHRGGVARPDTFTALDGSAETTVEAIYTTDVSAIDGGPALRSAVSHLPATLKLNFGLVDSDQDNEEGKEASNFHSSSVPVFKDHDNSGREAYSRSAEAKSLVSNVLLLESSNGLINPDQDMGAGEVTSGLQPAPVPVLSNQINSGREAFSRSAEAKSLVSNVLCLASKKIPPFPVFTEPIHSRRKSHSQSTEAQSLVSNVLCLASKKFPSVPVFRNQDRSGREAHSQSTEAQSLASCVLDLASKKPAVIYVETLSLFPIDSLEFRVWNPYLNELEAPKPVTEILPLSLGTVFEGSWGTKNVQYVTPPLTEFARLTIRNDRFKYLDRFLIQPGDSVRIRLDFQTATVLFSGPSAEKFQAQYELAKAIASERFAKNPIMFTGKSNYWGHSVDDSLRILQAKTTASAIRPAIQFVSPDSSGLRYLEAGFSEDLNTHSAWKILELYQDKLPDEFWQILKADVQGWLQYDQIKHFLYLRLGLENNPKYQQLYREHILQDQFPLPNGAEWSVYYIDYLFQKLTTISYMEKKSMVSLIPSLPREVRDPVYAKFLIKNFRNFEDSNLQFEQALAIIETPWIKGVIDTLYHAQRIGAPLAEIPLVNTKGDAVILQGGDGKIRFIQFWLPGCQASASYYAKLLAPVVEHYKDDPEVEFVFISNDSDHNRWLENISAETYSDKEALNLNAPGRYHPYLKYYHMYAFPEQMVVDRAGGVVNLGNVPKTPEGLIQYLDSLKNSPYSTNQPNAK